MHVSQITISVNEALETALTARMAAIGADSREDYLLSLVECDCAANDLDQTLLDRLEGPFVPLPPDWKAQVRQTAAALA